MGHWLDMGQQQLYSEMILECYYFLIKLHQLHSTSVSILKLKLHPSFLAAAYLKDKLYFLMSATSKISSGW